MGLWEAKASTNRVKSVEKSGKTRPKKAPVLDLTMRRSSVSLVKNSLSGVVDLQPDWRGRDETVTGRGQEVETGYH